MRTLVTYLILLLIAGGLTYYYLSHREAVQRKETAERLSKRLFPHGEEQDTTNLSDEVAEVTLTPRGATQEIVLVREESSPETTSDWRITQPRRLPADQSAVSSLVSTLVGLELGLDPDRSVLSGVASNEMTRYGLDEPGLRIGLRYRGEDTPRVLRVGGQDPSQRYRYAMIEGEPNVLVIQDRDAALNKDLFALRDKVVMPLSSDKVLSLEIADRAGQAVLRVARPAAAEPWRLHVPTRDDADESQVNSLISQLNNARAQAFLVDDPTPEDIEKNDLASPEYVITAVSAEGADRVTRELLVGPARGENRVAMLQHGTSIFTLPNRIVDNLTRDPANLRDHMLAKIPTDDIERITYEVPGHTLVITPRPATSEAGTTQWVVANPPEGFDDAAAEDKLRTLATSLASLRARDVLPEEEAQDLAALGLEPPEARIVIDTENEEHPVVLEFGSLDRRNDVQGRAARRLGRDAVLFLEAWRANQLVLNLDDLGLATEASAPPLAPYGASPEITAETATPETAAAAPSPEVEITAEAASPTV